MATQPMAERPDSFHDLHQALVGNLEQVIQGKPDAIELVLLALVAEGHVLVEDVPGVGKTTLAKALARSIDGGYGRIQFTPDLLPSDVVGVNVWNRSTGAFDFRPGPVFANIVLADEINRASPKTQSALLEVMEEGRVTVDGQPHPVGRPFMVIATQNPIEQAGTYRLPEAQLDRFLMKTSLGYPDRAATIELLVNAKVERPWQDLVNSRLAAAAERHPNAILVDWHGLSEGHPEWFARDGIHLTQPGSMALAEFIADAVEVEGLGRRPVSLFGGRA